MFFLLIYTCKLDQALVSINQYNLINSLGGIQIWLTASRVCLEENSLYLAFDGGFKSCPHTQCCH